MSALEKRILRKKQSQQEAHGDDKEEEEKQKSLIPYREWNASDFMGKCRIIIAFPWFIRNILQFCIDHGTKIKNKLAPIPGTQLRVEKEHEEAKQFYEEYLKQVQQDHFRKAQTKVTVKKQAATLQTNVYFDTLFNTTIDKAEAILNEKERLLNNANESVAFDELTTIDKFRKFVAQGKAHYIGMAVSNGYKSIDYQDPNDHGNTCLHIACRRGYLDVVEELLKYKANPDLPNEYGNYPIHEAWMFWKTDTHLRTREERLDQEDRTAEIVLKLLAYGAWVDARDQKLQTPLHIACRLGTTRTVKVLLTFFADIDVAMKDGLTALDIAEEFEQWETLRLLQSWVHIRPHFVHTDFHVIWRKFLLDYEAIISNNKTAEQILSELELEQNAHYMQRMAKKHMVLIDDPLLQQAFIASESCDGEQKIPKPWEQGWRRYVKQTKMAGVMDLKTRLESLKTKLKDSESKKTGQLMPRQPTDGDRRRRKLPDRPTPLTWQEQQEALAKKKALLAIEQDTTNDGDNDAEENDADSSSDGRLGGSISGNGSVAIARSQIYSIQFGQVGSDKEASTLRMVDPRPQLVQRRCRFAQHVALDAKFLPFTKRLTQDSALSLSLRTAQAPIANTEEDGTIMRTILNQGVEFDRLEKYQAKESLHDILGIKTTPKKNHLGAYCEATKMSEPNARDALYDQLSNLTERNVIAGAMTSPAGKTAATAAAGTSASSSSSSKPSTASASTRDKTAAAAAKLDPDVKKKIDLVGGDRHNPRPRYVDAALLPAKVEPTKVELMMRAAAKAEEEKLLQKANLSSEATRAEARNQIAASIAAASRDENDNASTRSSAAVSVDGDDGDDNNSVEVSQAKRRAAAQRQRALRKLFLSDTKVKYGEGRLLSSHHMRGKLPEPWTSVDDKYKTVAGDRTV